MIPSGNTVAKFSSASGTLLLKVAMLQTVIFNLVINKYAS